MSHSIREGRSSALSAAIEAVLDSGGPGAGAVARQVREAVLRSDASLTERALPGWRAVSFHHPESGFVCAVFPQTQRVDLAFERGVDLTDPDGLLIAGRTSSRRVRYLRFAVDRSPDADVIDFFVQQAVTLPRR